MVLQLKTPNEFPPQARGWTVVRAMAIAFVSVSPAGAGMDPQREASPTVHRGFPRRRGDGPAVEALTL